MGRFECGANSRDHPRLRGEQCIVYRPYFFNLGSPPLARGTDNVAKCPPPARGITPACAGNRRFYRARTKKTWDHPRLRGEQPKSITKSTAALGSPPLARGTGSFPRYSVVCCGITPACAGNSYAFPACVRAYRDHPRLRGEQYAVDYYTKNVPGSPPLARGTVIHWLRDIKGLRITPACAGNRGAAAILFLVAGDHPRLRGEQRAEIMKRYFAMGSPPLARGTDMGGMAAGGICGITPACAGNSFHQTYTLQAVRDHPRLRGEQAALPS